MYFSCDSTYLLPQRESTHKSHECIHNRHACAAFRAKKITHEKCVTNEKNPKLKYNEKQIQTQKMKIQINSNEKRFGKLFVNVRCR